MNRKVNSGGPHPNMEAFLSLAWHGAHNKGLGKNRDIYNVLNIVDDVKGGQFEFYFCSIKCFKKWFNQIIDDFQGKFRK